MKNIVSKSYPRFVNNLLLAVIIAVSMLGIDKIYWLYNGYASTGSPLKQIELLLLCGLLLSLFPKTRYAIGIYLFMVLMLFVELVHFSYFGSRLTAVEISLFFSHTSETMVTFDQIWHISIMPLCLCLIAALITLISFIFLKERSHWRYAWLLVMVMFFLPLFPVAKTYLLHKPVKTPTVKVANQTNSNDDLIYAMHKTLVYYFVYTLPNQLRGINTLPQVVHPPFSIKTLKPNINIIFIQGESLTRKHMSAYGYHRLTTPFLDSLKKDKNVVFKNGISLGVCTDVSLPLFFNMIAKPDGSKQIASTNRNLFKMAKQNGFVTHFISTHSYKNFGNIQELLFPAYIDHYQILGETNHFSRDSNLINYLKKVNFKQPTFLVLQPGGSHSPYEWRYPPRFNHFNTKNPSFRQEQIDSYDNSVLHSDDVIRHIVKLVKEKTKRPTYVVFTSDHGENLGENGVFGHNNLQMRAQHQVPIVIIAINGASLAFLEEKTNKDINKNLMSNYELSKIIAQLLGYNVKNLSMQTYGYYVTGVILNGSNGYNHLTFDHNGKLHNHYYLGTNTSTSN